MKKKKVKTASSFYNLSIVLIVTFSWSQLSITSLGNILFYMDNSYVCRYMLVTRVYKTERKLGKGGFG
jgi:hypothetical protein